MAGVDAYPFAYPFGRRRTHGLPNRAGWSPDDPGRSRLPQRRRAMSKVGVVTPGPIFEA